MIASAIVFLTLVFTLLCAPAAGIEVRLLAFHPGSMPAGIYAHDPATDQQTDPTKLEVRGYLNHEFSTLPISGRRVFFTAAPDRNAQQIAETTLPVGISSAILLFLPGDSDGKHKILPIDDSSRAFPAGSFRVSNFSPAAVRLVLEDTPHHLKSGETLLITDPPVRAGNQTGMKAFAFYKEGWRRIGSGLWPHPGKNRVVQILFRDPVTGIIQLKAYDDIPPRTQPLQP
jgi:hypothetical protein